MVFEEFDAMVESGEIDEGALTQLKGWGAGKMAQAKDWGSALKKKAIGGALGLAGEKDAAAQFAGQAADIEKQGQQKALVAKAKQALKPLGSAYEEFKTDAEAMGIMDLPALKKAATDLSATINAMDAALANIPPQQQAQAGGVTE